MAYGLLFIVGVLNSFLTVNYNTYFLKLAEITSESMYKTIETGNTLLTRGIYDPSKLKRGDIITFKVTEKNQDLLYIKRLIGLPYDHIKFIDGELYINDEKINEPYISYEDKFNGEFVVPADHYFFLGDNRLLSYDSRYLEQPFIQSENLYGKAIAFIFPIKKLSIITNPY
ncbi:MAG: signal peptidase I [Epulopiscium sp. Nele67-Bin004]|nr:MAG: signal peptidase I [Epulopiscium sp. Nele67-Bin004]